MKIIRLDDECSERGFYNICSSEGISALYEEIKQTLFDYGEDVVAIALEYWKEHYMTAAIDTCIERLKFILKDTLICIDEIEVIGG